MMVDPNNDSVCTIVDKVCGQGGHERTIYGFESNNAGALLPRCRPASS